MFELIRSHSRLTLAFLLLLIIPSFVVFGIEGYSRFSGGRADTVARVDGQSITREEWDRAHDRVVDRLRRQQPGVELGAFNTAAARLETLEALLRERVLFAAARDMHFMPSDARLARLFRTDPNMAGVRNPDGSVNRDVLLAQGMSSEGFAEQLRQDYAMRQVLGGLASSALVPKGMVAVATDALMQRREAQYQHFDPAVYAATLKPTDAEIEAYYKANESQFRAPEQADIEYVVLDHAALGRDIAIGEDEARKFLDANAARFTAPEERRASHILVKADADKPAAERAKAKAKAESLLAEARKNPAGFAELARKNSEDPGSAAQGGDLDFFGRGAMVKPFEDAVFALKPGELSGVVESDFGYHVILLAAVRGGQRKPFEAVRDEIVAELRKAQVAKRWPAAAEQFNDLAYQQSDSLQPLIDKFKVEKKSGTVRRTPAPGAAGPLASQRLLDAVFAADALRDKRNTDAIEFAPNQLAVARIVQHRPARLQPLADVKDAVRARVVATQAAAQARQDGQSRLAALKASAAETLPKTAVFSRLQPGEATREWLDAVLRADPAQLPQVTGVDLGESGYVVLRITRVLPPELPPGGGEQMTRLYGQAWVGAETEAYLAALKRRYKAEISEGAQAAAAAAAASSAGF